jgi:hypothetical protein
MVFVLLAWLLLQPVDTGDATDLYRRVSALPPAVRDVIERRANCNHWGGEEPYDAARYQQIAQVWKDLRCATVRGEAACLRRHFASSREIVELLDLTAEESGWVGDPPKDD